MRVSIVFILAIVCLPLLGQREVYFADSIVANKKIESLHGLEMSLIPNKSETSIGSFFGDNFNISGYFGYFYEAPISRIFSLKMATGLHNLFYNKVIFEEGHDYYSYNDFTYERSYKAIFHIAVEPRWYYSFDKRYDIGKSRLNSGWFIGCPVSYEYSSNSQLYITPSLGFRQSLSNKIFIEADAGVGVERYLFAINKQLRFDYFISAKIAYTF